MYCIYFVAPFFKLTDVISHYPAQGRAEGGGQMGHLHPQTHLGECTAPPPPKILPPPK